MELRQNFSQNIHALRLARQSTLEEFSYEIGIGKTTLQEIESGKGNSTLDTIETIACKLQIHPLSLLSKDLTKESLPLSLSLLHFSEIFCCLPKTEQCKALKHFETLIQILGKAY